MDRNEVFVLVMSRSMFACWYHVGISARDQAKQISSGSLLSSMLRHCYHLYPYPNMIYMIIWIHICICIDVYPYLYLCHIFAPIYQLSQQWKPRPATQWSWSEAETRSGRIPFRHLEKGTTFSRWIWLLLFDEQCVKSTVYSIINRFLLLICQFVCVLHDISGLNQMYCQYFISLWAFQFICVHMWLSFISSYVICVEMADLSDERRDPSAPFSRHRCQPWAYGFSRDSPIQPTCWKAGLAWSLPQSLVLPLHCAQESDYAKAVEASISCGGIWSQNLWWFGQTSTSKELETLILKASGSLGKRKPCVHPVVQ